MSDVVVLGGYGRLGRLLVRALLAQTRASIGIAGHNAQRAEALALSSPERARGLYANARDPRTLARALDGASCAVACCGGDLLNLVHSCLERRIPLISSDPLSLDARSLRLIAEVSWKAQVAVVPAAGAVPGLPGIAAEWLVRAAPRATRIRIASTGAWLGSDTALQSVATQRPGRTRWLPETQDFGAPIGVRRVSPSTSADLDGFTRHNTVAGVDYLEPGRDRASRVVRGLERVFGRGPEAGFALTGLALAPASGGSRVPLARIELSAADPLTPAVSVIASLVGAQLGGGLPAGLSQPHEAINPLAILRDLEKAGVRIALGASTPTRPDRD